MAKSLAFWVEGSNLTQTSITAKKKSKGKQKKKTAPSPVGIGQAEVELHFNYWSVSASSPTAIDYLDVGVKFSGIESFETIKIFFPFNVTENSYVASLGRTVCNTPTLISAIFNTRVKETKHDGERMDITFRHEKDLKLRFHSQIALGPHGDGVTLSRLSGGSPGTTLSFPIKLFKREKEDRLDDLPHYFRFRIKMSAEDKSVLSQTYSAKDSWLLSHFDSTEIVDFRVNEIRNLPAQIRSKLEYDSYISSVHFFLIRETNSEHKLSHTEFKRCRVLEKDLWETYLKEDDQKITLPDKMLIYHWRELSKRDQNGKLLEHLENFSAFAKFSKTVVSNLTIFIFLFSLIIIGAVSGIAGNYAYTYMTEKPESKEQQTETTTKKQSTEQKLTEKQQ
ncbi:hypothetical protein GVN15_25745 [Pseudomonas putida]|uniref:hypothetical protein n=1 Tax=Pseudomonas putida TaxID=303 RepID=UPI001378A7D0|nr:hypothetical protein [Pseudomonas putida]NBA84045.1 hypothetical protein [Pseudomonas putida]